VARFTDPLGALLNLQRALDSRRLSDWFGGSTASRGGFPPINVFRQGDDFVVVAELPGVDKDDLEIQIRQKNLRLAGRKTVDYTDDVSVHRRERVGGSFDRTITFPVNIDPDGAKAEYRDGVLKLFVPRSPAEKPRKIAIR
jgi:HSP20 family protein